MLAQQSNPVPVTISAPTQIRSSVNYSDCCNPVVTIEPTVQRVVTAYVTGPQGAPASTEAMTAIAIEQATYLWVDCLEVVNSELANGI